MRARLVVLILLATAAAADQPRPMTAVDLLSVPIQSDVRLAPGGKVALFVRTQPDWDQDKLVSHIWKVGADGSGAVRMTNGTTGERSPRWSPDGNRFCFVATRGGETAQLFVQSFESGEATQVVDPRDLGVRPRVVAGRHADRVHRRRRRQQGDEGREGPFG